VTRRYCGAEQVLLFFLSSCPFLLKINIISIHGLFLAKEDYWAGRVLLFFLHSSNPMEDKILKPIGAV